MAAVMAMTPSIRADLSRSARGNPGTCGAGRLPGAAGHRSLRPVPGADQHRLTGAMSRRTWRKDPPMRAFAYVTAALSALPARVRGDDPERGDVPGWVMITVMTAALVLAILVP